MRVSIHTLGTRGDVQPYVALARRLVREGHSAVICTGESFRALVERDGVEFRRAASDLMAMLGTEEGRAVMQGGMKHPLRAMRYAREVVNPAFRESLDDFWDASQGADVILYHPKALAAPDMAQALGIPCVSVTPVPITYPVSEFPNMAIAPTTNFGAALNRLSYAPMAKADAASIKEINDWRASRGLPARKAGTYAYEIGGKPIPIVCPVSPALFEDVTSWIGRVYLPGFFYLDSAGEAPDPEIEAFLQAGDAPIAVSFSSMPLRDPRAFAEALDGALQKTVNRAVLLTGNAEIDVPPSARMLCVPAVPHALLFPRCKGIVHHGGVGTLAEALRSGVPQQIVPFAVDQPFWAHRMQKLGYAVMPMREKELSTGRLAQTFREMENPAYIESARRIRQRLLCEDGVGAAVRYIEGIVDKG